MEENKIDDTNIFSPLAILSLALMLIELLFKKGF
jgi:hypothetical protein